MAAKQRKEASGHMARATKAKYEEILDEILDSIAEHVDSLPEEKKKRVIKAIRAYSLDAPRRLSKTGLPRNGTVRSPGRSRPR